MITVGILLEEVRKDGVCSGRTAQFGSVGPVESRAESVCHAAADWLWLIAITVLPTGSHSHGDYGYAAAADRAGSWPRRPQCLVPGSYSSG